MRAFLVASHQPGISDDIDENRSCGTPSRPPLIRAVVRGRVVDTDHHHRRNNSGAATTIVTPKDCSRQGQSGKCKACLTESLVEPGQSPAPSQRAGRKATPSTTKENTRLPHRQGGIERLSQPYVAPKPPSAGLSRMWNSSFWPNDASLLIRTCRRSPDSGPRGSPS